jgi:hypothetical protein
MALNTIGLIEGTPGASRLENASLKTEHAQTLQEQGHKLYKLFGIHGALKRDAQNALNVSDTYLGKPRIEIITEKNKAASQEHESYRKVRKAFKEAEALKKQAKRDRKIGQIQQVCGRILGRRASVLPILTR